MTRPAGVRRRTLGAAALALGLTGATAGPASGTTGPRAADVRTPLDLVAWARAHPDRASIVVLRGDEAHPAFALAGDRPMPLASVRKVLLLLAATHAVAAGRLDRDAPVPLADVERWYAPGTDAGAHPAAVAGLGTDWTLDTVLRAMVTCSDNAAADWVLHAVGGPAVVDRLTDRLGMRGEDPAWPFLGEYLAWQDRPRTWRRATPADRQRIAVRLADRAHGPVRVTPPGPARQRVLALASHRGEASRWARLMRRVTGDAARGDRAAAYAVDVLSWPLRDPANAAAFATFATKGGSFAGVVTEVTAIRTTHGEPVFVAQLYRDLPAVLEQRLGHEFLHQRLYVALARDPHLLDGL